MSSLRSHSRPHPVYSAARAARDAQGIANLAPTDVAKLVRHLLHAKFPAVKFSVRTTSYTSISVRWTDGPTERAVDDLIGAYAFGGFDGMIDLAYSSQNWLLPDGSITFAATRGTEGSRGTVAGQYTDCPAPGAILVSSPVKYVHGSRRESPELWAPWIRWAAARFGCVNPTAPWHDQRSESDYLTTHVRRYWADLWRNDMVATPGIPQEV